MKGNKQGAMKENNMGWKKPAWASMAGEGYLEEGH